jgi:mono/diheme cytochrome c family protein
LAYNFKTMPETVRLKSWMTAWVVSLVACSPSLADEAAGPIRFEQAVAPVLLQKCSACHGAQESKGGYRLDTFAALKTPGASKLPVISPGEPENSLLYSLLITEDEEDRMPQKDARLPQEQIEQIRAWIEQGARFEGDEHQTLSSYAAPAMRPAPPDRYPLPVPVSAMAFARAGTELFTGGFREILAWDPADGKLLRRLPGFSEKLQEMRCMADGTQLLAVGGDPGRRGELILVDLQSAQSPQILLVAPDMFLALALSLDERWAACGGADNTIHIYDLQERKRTVAIQQHADWVMALSFSPDGTRLVSASRDRSARIYSLPSGELELNYAEHSAPVVAADFFLEGEALRVITASRSSQVHLWNVSDGRKAGEIGGGRREITRLLRVNSSVFTATAGGEIREHATADRRFIRTLSGHADRVTALAWGADSKRLASGSHDGEVRIWNLETGEATIQFIAAPQ